MDLRTSSHDFVLQFIKCLRDNPCLWQTTCKEYKSKVNRIAAYVKLLHILNKYEPGTTIDHVKKKLQSLRASHRKERKKVLNSMRTCSGLDVYRPKLWYYDELQFLNDHNQLESSTSSTLDGNLNEDENLNHSSTHSDALQDRDEESQINNKKTNSETEINGRIEHNNISLASSAQETHRKRNIVEETMPSFITSHKKHHRKLDVLNRTVSNLRDIFVNNETNKVDESDDECLTFGRYIGLQLRKLSSEKRICTQSSIHNLISDALLSEIRERVRSSTSLSVATSHTDESYSDQNASDFVTTQYN